MDRLDALAFFVAIIERNGVAAAGREFGLSAASASQRLSFLEEHYGAQLLHRSTRSFSLTEEGQMLLDASRDLLAESNDLESRIKLGVQNLSGLIKISAPQDLGSNIVSPILDSFIAQYPQIEIELYLDDNYLDLAGLGLDIGVRLGILANSSLLVRKVADNRRIVCAAPYYLAKNGCPNKPEDLPMFNCLIMRLSGDLDRDWEFITDSKKKIVRISGDRISNNGAKVREWCVNGKGIALKSIWDVREDIKQGRLVEILADNGPKSKSALQLVFPPKRIASRRVNKLSDYLVSELNKLAPVQIE